MAEVQIESVAKRFGGLTVIEEFSLHVKDREFLSLLGPSGCGKTTVLRMVAGFGQPDSGRIRMGDRLLAAPAERVHVPPEERGIGMVFQSYAVWPHMTVFDNVAFPLKLRKLSRQEIASRVERMIDQVQLSGLGGRYPSELSGGQQQRVALARALVMEPSVLLLDEPLSNLDAKLRETMRFEIKELQRRLGVTILYVTHDQAEAMAMSDRIVVMNRGQIAQAGTPAEVYERPADAFVADFVGVANLLPCEVLERGQGTAVVRLAGAPGDYTFRCQSPGEVGAEPWACIRPEQVRIGPVGVGLPAMVERVTYLGDRIDCQVRLGTHLVRALLQPGPVPGAGEPVGVSFESAYLLKR